VEPLGPAPEHQFNGVELHRQRGAEAACYSLRARPGEGNGHFYMEECGDLPPLISARRGCASFGGEQGPLRLDSDA